MRRFGQFDVGRGEGGNFVSYVRGNWAIAGVREVEVTKKVILRRLGQFDVGRGEGGFFVLYVRGNWAIAEVREVEATTKSYFEAIRAI